MKKMVGEIEVQTVKAYTVWAPGRNDLPKMSVFATKRMDAITFYRRKFQVESVRCIVEHDEETIKQLKGEQDDANGGCHKMDAAGV